jgi:hypothetical protein
VSETEYPKSEIQDFLKFLRPVPPPNGSLHFTGKYNS